MTLYEAIKTPVAVYDTTEFLSKLKTTHKDNPTNVSLLRKDFKVNGIFGVKKSLSN